MASKEEEETHPRIPVVIDDSVEIGTLYCTEGYFRGVLYTFRNKSNYTRRIVIEYQEPGKKLISTECLFLYPHSYLTYPGATCIHMKILN